jgi:hypothetical protein
VGEYPFSEVQDELAARCQLKFDLARTDEEQGEIIFNFILERERLRRNATVAGPGQDAIDRETLKTLQNPFSLGPDLSIAEVVFRRLCVDPSSAAAYLNAALQQRSAAQSRRASKPRPKARDGITQAIEEILEDRPRMSAKHVGLALKDHDEVFLQDNEYRHRFDASTLRVSNLASRVSEARKRVSDQPG